ncbi:hypothetical protein WJ73_05160 [Burkholderia ubonensis]|nr:hypothetical protein WJ73_05160 [Burkholderia ubonensis]
MRHLICRCLRANVVDRMDDFGGRINFIDHRMDAALQQKGVQGGIIDRSINDDNDIRIAAAQEFQ